MAVCELCSGEGVQRVECTDPLFNVVGMVLVGNVWTGTCRRCRGDGILEWSRGRSLPPIVPGQPAGQSFGRYPSR